MTGPRTDLQVAKRMAPPVARSVVFATLGCKVNQYETQVLREQFAALGFGEASSRQGDADLAIVNTCTVTGEGARKSRAHLRRLMREHPRAFVVVTGCHTESDRQRLERMPGVDLVLGNADKARLAARVIERFAAERLPIEGEVPDFGISRMEGHTRAFVNVQQGCDLWCSFCIIPRVRGPLWSRPEREVLAEARRLADNGYREIVLTGVHLGAYGRDTGDHEALARLVAALCGVEGLARVRLSSIEIHEVTDALLDVLAGHPQAMPSLHLPLQSGDDGVLARMRRRYRAAEFVARAREIRAALDDPGLTTDVIVAFPGESDAAFENTVSIIRQCRFHRVHRFPFSPRQGTPAARYDGRVPDAVARSRMARLDAVAREIFAMEARRRAGQRAVVLIEGPGETPDTALGYCERYHRVELPDAGLRANDLCEVILDHADGERFLARPLVANGTDLVPWTNKTG